MKNKSTSFESNGKKQIKGKSFVLDFSSPLVMGILNVTPDSFFDGGKYIFENNFLDRAEMMMQEGVDIIDVGGVSTRPGSKAVSVNEELERVLKPLKLLKKKFPDAIVSIDTYSAYVAEVCVGEGADIINDISGGDFDPNMFKTVAKLEVPYILMHIKGTPETMQKEPVDTGIIEKVRTVFEKKVETLFSLGNTEVILDPGFGFGKSLECNYRLLKEMESVRVEGLPVLAGVSRKSMINKVLKIKPDDALNGTSVLHLLALQNGADILRVHDVKEAKEVIKLFEFYDRAACF